MGRPRKPQQAILVEPQLGVYGKCGECGADILYYSDYGVKCSNCHKLFGTWSSRRPRTQQQILEEEAMKKRMEEAESALNDLI
jgi:hypothetical protein